MATIGLDRLYYAKITEGENGEETYATPTPLAKAISAELSVELAEAILYADDGAAEIVKDSEAVACGMQRAVELATDGKRQQQLAENIAKLAISDSADRVVREIEQELANLK